MRLFQFNPTIRETNRYLNKAVTELTEKYGSVSNPDFERELVARTGIAWKQVKNYKNHPRPSQRLKDNSIVIRFVLDCRRRDTGRKLQRISAMALISLMLCYGVFSLVRELGRTKVYVVNQLAYKDQFKMGLKSTVALILPDINWTLMVGPLKESNIPISKFTCVQLTASPLTNCTFSEGAGETQLQVVLLLDQKFVRQYTIMAFNSETIKSVKEQLANVIANRRPSRMPANMGPLTVKQYVVGDEAITVETQAPGPSARDTFVVTVGLSERH